MGMRNDCNQAHKAILHYVVAINTPTGCRRTTFSPCFGEISNPDGTWPAITPRQVRRIWEASVGSLAKRQWSDIIHVNVSAHGLCQNIFR